ncbi:MAG: cupin domain-containing protein [Minwuia sp.]|uniref:cupin domain-containing protein n=1 Tax=Minwuia sp. TaxID=2493630 RepID=UPI003A8B9F47
MTDYSYSFDDRRIDWASFQGFDGLHYYILSVDHEDQVVDVLMKFDPHAECVPHRHVGPTKTLVIEGVHSLYDPTPDHGPAKVVRHAGGFGSNRGNESHVEGGGPDGAVILLMMSAIDGKVFELLDPDGSAYRTLTMDDFQRGLDRQIERAAA